MVIPASCKDIINRNQINECCEPDLERKPLNKLVRLIFKLLKKNRLYTPPVGKRTGQ